MRQSIHPDAVAELREDAKFYQEREFGLGRQLIDAVEATIAKAQSAPETGPSGNVPGGARLR